MPSRTSPQRGRSRVRRSSRNPSTIKKSGRCYDCGKPGHYRGQSICPNYPLRIDYRHLNERVRNLEMQFNFLSEKMIKLGEKSGSLESSQELPASGLVDPCQVADPNPGPLSGLAHISQPGNQAFQAYQGIQGYPAQQEIQGYPIQQGHQQNQGYPVQQGRQGYQTTQGYQVNQGYQGQQGYQVHQGYQGRQGRQGRHRNNPYTNPSQLYNQGNYSSQNYPQYQNQQTTFYPQLNSYQNQSYGSFQQGNHTQTNQNAAMTSQPANQGNKARPFIVDGSSMQKNWWKGGK